MLTILAFFIVFGVVVFFHEMGHFIVAKLAGIKVYEFSLGFGPRLFSFKKDGTIYGINAFPLGGLVRVAGLDEIQQEKAKPAERYENKSWSVRAGVLFAGPFMNLVLAFLIFVFLFSVMGVPQKSSSQIMSVYPGSPASLAGWQAGDTIEYFNGKKVTEMDKVITAIHKAKESELSFIILHQGQRYIYQIKPEYYPKQDISLLGISLKPLSYKRYNPGEAILKGLLQTFWITKEIFIGFFRLFAERASFTDIAGPIGIAKLSGEAAAQGWLVFLQFIAILSINLGILNILPIPALDGGRLLFLYLEKIFGKKISIEKERFIHYLGFSFLIILFILITLQDLKKIFE